VELLPVPRQLIEGNTEMPFVPIHLYCKPAQCSKTNGASLVPTITNWTLGPCRSIARPKFPADRQSSFPQKQSFLTLLRQHNIAQCDFIAFEALLCVNHLFLKLN
jgi:hypothetical protein